MRAKIAIAAAPPAQVMISMVSSIDAGPVPDLGAGWGSAVGPRRSRVCRRVSGDQGSGGRGVTDAVSNLVHHAGVGRERDRADDSGRVDRGAAHRGAGSMSAVLALALATAGCGTLIPGVESAPSRAAATSTAAGAASVGATPGAGAATSAATPAAGAAPGASSVAAGPGPAPAPGTALAALAALPVKGRAPATGYTRDAFGPAWADVDHDGCDQRDQVLARDLTAPTFRPGPRICLVLTGKLLDAYTGATVPFTRGQGTGELVEIDHVVSLADAWQTGAQALDGATRARLAGDPLNLQAVESAVDLSKGEGDAATWLPPSHGYRCTYVARQIAVKATYRLWVTPSEHDSMTQILDTCPDQSLPRSPLNSR